LGDHQGFDLSFCSGSCCRKIRRIHFPAEGELGLWSLDETKLGILICSLPTLFLVEYGCEVAEG
jgi:hypothetical protein